MRDWGTWFGWVDERNEHQARWALAYIDRQGGWRISREQSHPYRQLLSASCDPVKPDEREQFVRRMKNAWAQKKFRQKPFGQKTSNFALRLGIKQKLAQMAKWRKQTVRATLEDLISGGFGFEKLQRAEDLALRRQHRQEQFERRTTLYVKSVNKERERELTLCRDELEEMTVLCKRMEKALDSQLRLLSRYKILVADAQLPTLVLSEEQKSKAMDYYQHRKTRSKAFMESDRLISKKRTSWFTRMLREPQDSQPKKTD
jgi:hypothetical protein